MAKFKQKSVKKKPYFIQEPYGLPFELTEKDKFRYPLPSSFKTKEEARQFAIAWQSWVSEQSLSYGEMIEYANYFEKLGKKFGLIKEFKENGIL